MTQKTMIEGIIFDRFVGGPFSGLRHGRTLDKNQPILPAQSIDCQYELAEDFDDYPYKWRQVILSTNGNTENNGLLLFVMFLMHKEHSFDEAVLYIQQEVDSQFI